VLAPIAFPIAWCLDHAIEEEPPTERPADAAAEVVAIMRLQRDESRAPRARVRAAQRSTSPRPSGSRSPSPSSPGAGSGDDGGASAPAPPPEACDGGGGDGGDDGDGAALFTEEEIDEFERIVDGVRSLATTSASDIMVPAEKIFALPSSAVLDAATMGELVARGFSRVPIYDVAEGVAADAPAPAPPPSDDGGGGSAATAGGGAAASTPRAAGMTENNHGDVTNIMRYLIVKELLLESPRDNRPVRALRTREPAWVAPDAR
jgi:hypothetical protein